ncbi:MAG: hypothetical protein M1813_001351 [Trichoglossum hirsutum]|nr:MAG: hypothetical protein M1813_001351 [Trichoglossum hirsutum]
MSREPDSEAGSWRELDRSATAGSFLADHNLHIRENELDTGESAWYPVDSKAIIDHSTVLHKNVSYDKESGRDSTLLGPIHPVTFDALNTIVKAISRSHVGGRMGQKKGGFRDILDLSIGLWNFRCSKKLFVSFANRVREKEWSQATRIRTQTQHEGWMFIALVFEWRLVFEEASQELICDYSSPDDMPGYLPDELQIVIREERVRLMEDTFSHAREIWIGLWDLDQPSMNVIFTRLEALNINLRKPKTALPENISPQKLLRSFENVLENPLEQALAPGLGILPRRVATTTSVLTKTATTRTHAGSRVGASSRVNFGEYIKAGIDKIRKKDEPKPSNSPDTEFLRRWESEVVPLLRGRISEFREDKFKGLKIEQFSSLRSEQMLEG